MKRLIIVELQRSYLVAFKKENVFPQCSPDDALIGQPKQKKSKRISIHIYKLLSVKHNKNYRYIYIFSLDCAKYIY